MYNELEKYYKKNSRQIKTRKIVTIAYSAIITIILIIDSITPGSFIVKTSISLILIMLTTAITAIMTKHYHREPSKISSNYSSHCSRPTNYLFHHQILL